MKQSLLLLIIGCTAGVLSGLVGIGGGVILIPSLIFLLGFTQHMAEGTTLAALVPPIGILAAWVYYQSNQVDLKAATFIAAGFLVGGYFGAKLAQRLDDETLQKVFAVMMIGLGIKMLWPK
jgi:hypothetical protein